MNKRMWFAVALTLTLAACATGGAQRMYSLAEPRVQGFTGLVASAPNPTAPNVFVTADRMIVVDQEPIYPPAGSTVTIFFGLEQNGGYEFHNHGIEIQGFPQYCDTVTAYIARCSYTRPAAGTLFKYKIRVRPSGGGQPLRDLDPTIMN